MLTYYPTILPTQLPTQWGGGINGFTIIEVALVLAIAGLIFLVVFIAWPALQNSQQDNDRRQAVSRVITALESYRVDLGGSWNGPAWTPIDVNALRGYLYGKLPDGITINTANTSGSNPLPTTSTIALYAWAVCNADKTRFSSSRASFGSLFMPGPSQSSDAAVVIRLSSGNYYCQDI